VAPDVTGSSALRPPANADLSLRSSKVAVRADLPHPLWRKAVTPTRTRDTDVRQGLREVRALTEELARPLSPEDQVVQSMPDASPTLWHRAHTSWFFEEFLLGPAGVQAFDAAYRYLFNSYYEGVGPRHPRAERGMITRPGADAIATYRRHVDGELAELCASPLSAEQAAVLLLGINHEQQHQELLVMDIKHLLSRHPFGPAYAERPADPATPGPALGWRPVGGGLTEVGHAGEGFAYDNEGPRHEVWLQPFEIADRAVTNEDWLAFIDDGGYQRPDLWLSDGWAAVQARAWRSPEYWHDPDDAWLVWTLAGVRPLVAGEPVCHVSFYEADAYARWAGARLPTEHEWEAASAKVADLRGQQLDPRRLHPGPAGQHMVGDVWEWTASAYLPYPGFRPVEGAIGEYNGKFMCDQHVLRGASCATPRGHERTTYRNFFPAGARWAFSGLRLARS
jgi:ergothioneine biosynthesis protein EgtB